MLLLLLRGLQASEAACSAALQLHQLWLIGLIGWGTGRSRCHHGLACLCEARRETRWSCPLPFVVLTNFNCSTPQQWLLVQREGQGLPQALRYGICRFKFIGVCCWDAGRDLGAAHSRVIRELGADDRHFDIVVGHFQGALTHLKVDQVWAVMRAPCRSWLWSQEFHVLTH